MRYPLRTLLIVLAVLMITEPPLLALWWFLRQQLYHQTVYLPGDILIFGPVCLLVFFLPWIALAILVAAVLYVVGSVCYAAVRIAQNRGGST
jgi:hypothetical protein